MNQYKTAEIASIAGIHPNTVRLYEKLGLIPMPQRLPNGYRVFTDLHVRQIKLVRLAFKTEVLQNGLRKKMVQMVKKSAAGDYSGALGLAREYLSMVRQEQLNAEEAADIAGLHLQGETSGCTPLYNRKEASLFLGVTADTLRNWEMNGLLKVKRRQNGYRVYTSEDMSRLKVIRSLRCANYSLAAILRMLNRVNPHADIKALLNTPEAGEDIVAVCDKLITSLKEAENNASQIIKMLENM